jgi:ABC-2 type transport system permease protein
MKSKNIWLAFTEDMRGLWPKRILALVLVASCIIALFGLTFEKGPTQNISVDLVNLDGTMENSTAVSAIGVMSSGTTLHVINNYDSSTSDALEKSLDDLRSGRVEAVIVFGPNFTTDIRAWILSAKNGITLAPSSLTIYSDNSNPIASAAIQAEVQRSVQSVLVSTYKVSSPVRVANDIVYGADTDMRDFMAPAIAGLLIFILTMMPTLMASTKVVDQDKKRFSLGERMVAQCLSSFCVGIVLATMILTILAAFGIRMAGDMSVTLLLLALLALASAALGQVLASITRKHREATAAIFPLVLYTAILLGGIILPITSIPEYLLPLSYLFPLTYSIDGVRLAMLNGFGWEVCWVQVVALITYAGVCMAIAWWTEHRCVDQHMISRENEKASGGRGDRAL